MLTFAKARLFAFLLPTALIAGAYGSEYLGGLFPCEMCWWQRYPHFAAIGIAALALALRGSAFSKVLTALAAFAILTSGVIGGYHAGVEYHWWEGMTKCASLVSNDGGDILKSILEAPMIRCDVAPWTLGGISLAGFNFLLSCGGAALILTSLWKNKSA
jgi:disulfide bond formation protein DsbB